VHQLELRKFRFLFSILGLTLLAAIWEVSDPAPEDNPQVKLFPSTWAELYPESADTYYAIARNYAQKGDLANARLNFERALAKGDKAKEDLYFDYAVLLVRMEAGPQSIDRAIDTWKRYFPLSTRPDPSTARRAPVFEMER